MAAREEKIQEVMEIMDRVSQDMSVPRNIRNAAEEAKEALTGDEEDPVVRAASAISILDDVSNDPNIPVHTRTTIWSALSVLETIKDED